MNPGPERGVLLLLPKLLFGAVFTTWVKLWGPRAWRWLRRAPVSLLFP